MPQCKFLQEHILALRVFIIKALRLVHFLFIMTMKNYYVAYSIPGDHCFIMASKAGTDLEHEAKFSLALKRQTANQSVELNYAPLTHSTGRPQTEPTAVMRAFRNLEQQGWIVNDKTFKERYFAHLRQPQKG